jgi:hypothetical protein
MRTVVLDVLIAGEGFRCAFIAAKALLQVVFPAQRFHPYFNPLSMIS